MKRTLIIVAGALLLLLTGFFSGRAFQSAKNGYHYKLLERKEFASEFGPIQWTCFIESVGMPFLDPEKTMISIGNRTIYKAQRDFQENNPRARSIVTLSNFIGWEDGDYRYHLKIEPMGDSKQEAGASSKSQVNSSETNSMSGNNDSPH
jgi:hypothetical protein